MSLTPTQRQYAIEAHQALKSRGMVYLSGRQDGKTRTYSRVLETTTQQEGRKISLRARHAEDNDIEFVTGIFYGRSDKISPYTFMRTILQSLGQKVGRTETTWDIVKRFEAVLYEEFYKANRVLAVAIDNAELLPEKAYTVLKYLNEMRKDRHDIGCGVMVSGEFGLMRMPLAFLKRTKEIQVGKITAQVEIAQMIDTLWPGEASTFTDSALALINAKCETTLELRHSIGKVIHRKRVNALEEVDTELVRRTLALAA